MKRAILFLALSLSITLVACDSGPSDSSMTPKKPIDDNLVPPDDTSSAEYGPPFMAVKVCDWEVFFYSDTRPEYHNDVVGYIIARNRNNTIAGIGVWDDVKNIAVFGAKLLPDVVHHGSLWLEKNDLVRIETEVLSPDRSVMNKCDERYIDLRDGEVSAQKQ